MSEEQKKAALRELHGLKGEARMMGFADINTFDQNVVSFLELLRSLGLETDAALEPRLTITHGQALSTAQFYRLTSASASPVQGADLAVASGNVLANDTDADLEPLSVATVNGSAANVGVAVAGVYLWARRGEAVEATFLTTLVLLAPLIAMATQVIGDSIARAFSLVGALSIIRFRTPIKEPEEIAVRAKEGFAVTGMALARCSSSTMAPLWAGSRCWMTRPARR